MDPKLKLQLIDFYEGNIEQVGDLATWINAPQRRFHRHEFLGLAIGELRLPGGQKVVLRDLGYGGCGVVRNDAALADVESKPKFEAVLRILDREWPMKLQVRHATKFHVGCEFVDLSKEQHKFLQGFIHYMDGALQVRQVQAQTVFPQFSGKGWLNLAGHRDAIRFNIRFDAQSDQFEANLVYVYNRQHRYGSWSTGKVEIGVLDGAEPSSEERAEMLRQVVCMLIGIRQGASLPGFEPLTKEVLASLRLIK